MDPSTATPLYLTSSLSGRVGGSVGGGGVGSDVVVFVDSNTPPISFDYFECSPLCLVIGCVLQFG